jgi:hypothetical protein
MMTMPNINGMTVLMLCEEKGNLKMLPLLGISYLARNEDGVTAFMFASASG